MKDSISLAQFPVYGKLGFGKTIISLKRIRGLMKWMRKTFPKVEQKSAISSSKKILRCWLPSALLILKPLQKQHHLSWEPEDDNVNWLTLVCLQGPCNKNKGKNTTLFSVVWLATSPASQRLGKPYLFYREQRKAEKAGREKAIVDVSGNGEGLCWSKVRRQ